jgi:DNA-binding MarR family transcriptional regulator
LAPDKNSAIRRLSRAVEEFRKIDSEMPSQVMAVFLAVADDDGISMKDLSTQLDIAQSSLSRAVSALSPWHWLKRPGLEVIEQFIDPRDTRRKHVRMTPKGHQLAKRLMEVLK